MWEARIGTEYYGEVFGMYTRSLAPDFLVRQVRNVRRQGVLPAAVGMGCCAQHRAEQRRQYDAGELEGVVPCVQQVHGNSAIR